MKKFTRLVLMVTAFGFVALQAMNASAPPLPTDKSQAYVGLLLSAADSSEAVPVVVVAPKSSMVLIPSGSFIMGGTTNVGHNQSYSDELPQHWVLVSAFYMDRYEVTKALWDNVKAYKGGNGYTYSNTGLGKGAGHPVHSISWLDMVKWCNARSEKEGLEPVYYTTENGSEIYKTGLLEPYPDWHANGYRLPTEAEWEKAARGGVPNHRFPWSDSDEIQHTRANYSALPNSVYYYDTSATSGLHPDYDIYPSPYTSPVGSFAPNDYGLYDMAGNVLELCWDTYDATYYSNSPSVYPRGPSRSILNIVGRGGAYDYNPRLNRVAVRFYLISRTDATSSMGFRCARRG